MNVRVFEDIDDEVLASEWQRLDPGDFYAIAGCAGGGQYPATVRLIADYLLGFSSWDLFRIDQVNSRDPLVDPLGARGLPTKKATDIFELGFDPGDLDACLESLSRNRHAARVCSYR